MVTMMMMMMMMMMIIMMKGGGGGGDSGGESMGAYHDGPRNIYVVGGYRMDEHIVVVAADGNEVAVVVMWHNKK